MDVEEVVSILYEIENPIVFAGAGVSKQAGLPSWDGIIYALIRASRAYLEEEFCSELEKIFKQSKDHPVIAQRIYDALKDENKENIYFNTIKDELDPEYSEYAPPHIKIVKTMDKIVTTNFDSGFEFAFQEKELPKPTIETLPDLNTKSLHEGNIIVYIHGKTDENYIIFKKDDYEKYYPSISGNKGSDRLETYLKNIYREYTLVFVGFSFSDKYIMQFFKMQKERLEKNDIVDTEKSGFCPSCDRIKHYAFIKDIKSTSIKLSEDVEDKNIEKEEENRKKRFNNFIEDLKDINIEPIIYSRHKDWLKYFEKLYELKRAAAKKVDDPELSEFIEGGL